MTKLKLKGFEITEAPETVFYIANFISKDEEEYLTNQVYSAPKPKWKSLSNRRLQNWGGLPHPKGMIAERIPEWLERYTHKIADLGVFGDQVPNHILVNEYQPGQGIMPHEDGPLFHPVVTTISLGSHTVLDFYRHRSNTKPDGEMLSQDSDLPTGQSSPNRTLSLLLEPCSLLVLTKSMYTSYLHGITERTTDDVDQKTVNLGLTNHSLGDKMVRGRRISLTIRYVPKTIKVNLFGSRR